MGEERPTKVHWSTALDALEAKFRESTELAFVHHARDACREIGVSEACVYLGRTAASFTESPWQRWTREHIYDAILAMEPHRVGTRRLLIASYEAAGRMADADRERRILESNDLSGCLYECIPEDPETLTAINRDFVARCELTSAECREAFFTALDGLLNAGKVGVLGLASRVTAPERHDIEVRFNDRGAAQPWYALTDEAIDEIEAGYWPENHLTPSPHAEMRTLGLLPARVHEAALKGA